MFTALLRKQARSRRPIVEAFRARPRQLLLALSPPLRTRRTWCSWMHRPLSVFEYTAHEALRLLIDDLIARGLVVWEVSPPPDAEAAAARYREAHGDPGLRRFQLLEAAVAAYVDEVAPESR